MVWQHDPRPTGPVSCFLPFGLLSPLALLTAWLLHSGCKGGITRWEAKKALLMSNNQDNGDPGIEQQPRFNLTLSLSLDVSCHANRPWPFVCGAKTSV